MGRSRRRLTVARVAHYIIAQHIPDLFRNEPRNVGVIVQIDGKRTARFLGETGAGKVDGRKLKHMPYPEVYRQWVDYWNDEVASSDDALAGLLANSGQHYRIVEGGEVADVGEDNVHDVAQFLYTSLVSEEGLAKAIGGDDAEEVAVELQKDIVSSLADLGIVADVGEKTKVLHPVLRNATVQGKSIVHNPTLYQGNGHPIVIEPIDLTVARKATLKDHAGWASFMFTDVRNKHASAETIAIAKSTPGDLDDRYGRYAMDMLKSTASRIVEWSDSEQRDRFLKERLDTAKTA
jgi:hypothetical protein